MSMPRVGIVSTSMTQLRPAWDSAQHIDLISAVVLDVSGRLIFGWIDRRVQQAF